MFTAEEPTDQIDNSRIARSKKHGKTYKLERMGDEDLTYFVTWRSEKTVGNKFLVTRRSAAKQILILLRTGFVREVKLENKTDKPG